MSRSNMNCRWLGALLVAMCVMSMSACEQIKEVVCTRPSEKMPAYKPVTEVDYLNQNWSSYNRQWFYHAGQGTVLMPYRWFLALERPELYPFSDVPKFHDTAYLARFGFLPDTANPENPDGLPLGFAKDTVVDPQSGEKVDVVGLTCAACHTGQLEYKGKGIRIDGGSASADLASFQTELGFAVGFTEKIPGRFDRFARAVLGENATKEDKDKLHTEFAAFLSKGMAEKDAAEGGKLYAAAGGFGRTDALGRIGNFVFGTELDNQNLRVADAPVSFPPIWYTSWFNWVQYNASIQQPMVRNIGEALGVRARVNLTDPRKVFQATVNVKNLHAMEDQLAGPTAFNGLMAPKWPEEILGPIDQAKVKQGEALYKQHCEHCHLPPVGSDGLKDAKYWADGLQGRKFLELTVVPLEEIGTDPTAASNWADRKAATGGLGLGTVSAADGLRLVTQKIAEQKYAELGVTNDDMQQWNGYRTFGVTAPRAYRARPLSGLWATPPFLHNGSVPSLYQMLVPAERRDKSFFVGSREFDPKNVGYSTAPFEGGFEFRTDQPGNSNAGHEFRDGKGKGIIGPELTDEERWAIVEYLKVM